MYERYIYSKYFRELIISQNYLCKRQFHSNLMQQNSKETSIVACTYYWKQSFECEN